MEVNVRDGGLEKFSDLGLREPDGFIVKPTLDAGAAALGDGLSEQCRVSHPHPRQIVDTPVAQFTDPGHGRPHQDQGGVAGELGQPGEGLVDQAGSGEENPVGGGQTELCRRVREVTGTWIALQDGQVPTQVQGIQAGIAADDHHPPALELVCKVIEDGQVRGGAARQTARGGGQR